MRTNWPKTYDKACKKHYPSCALQGHEGNVKKIDQQYSLQMPKVIGNSYHILEVVLGVYSCLPPDSTMALDLNGTRMEG